VAFIALKKVVICYPFSTTNHVCTYVDGTNCRFTQKSVQKSEKGGASPKAQPHREGYMSLALLKALYPMENFGNIKGDRGAHVDYNAII
jgi:hypothetical protein